MSEIKLTADSGGGTTSIKAPSSTTSNADVVLKLPVADGSSGQVLKTDGSGQLSFGSDISDLVNDTSPQLGGDLDTNSHHILFDDSHAAKFGDSNDLQIYHNGNSIIENENNSCDLRILSDRIELNNQASTEFYLTCTANGAVELYYDNVKRISTNSGSYNGAIIHGAAANTSIAMQTETTSRGYFYANNSDQIGLLDAGGNWAIRHENDSHTQFRIANATKARIDADGLKFGTDTAAANALDDYEEGTWTPILNNGGSFSSASHVGKYTKIGRVVHWVCQVAGTCSGTGSGTFTISGLPFTSLNQATGGHGYAGCMGALYRWNIPNTAYQLGIRVPDNTSYIQLFANFDNADDQLLSAPFDSGNNVFGSLAGTYIT